MYSIFFKSISKEFYIKLFIKYIRVDVKKAVVLDGAYHHESKDANEEARNKSKDANEEARNKSNDANEDARNKSKDANEEARNKSQGC